MDEVSGARQTLGSLKALILFFSWLVSSENSESNYKP